MAFFPSTYNTRDQVVGILDLCEVETSDGDFRFMIGTDGIFEDSSGNKWYGSQLISSNKLQSAIDGVAPSGSIILSYFQDPDADNLIAQIKSQGDDYIKGKEIRFYIQPINSMSDFYAPPTAPLKWCTRIMRSLAFSASGAQDRSITLTFETWAERRNSSRRIVYNTQGHAELIGESNPSLEFMPTTDFDEEKLFG